MNQQPPRPSTPATTLALLLVSGLASAAGAPTAPIALHPENPHYFTWRGRPTVLVTSGEHYGAVLNLDFDHERYLDTLARDGLNLTRTFTGAYLEPQGAFRIARNTLAPARGRLIAPWARSDTPGYAGGGAKFDLTRFSDAYFERLRAFVAHAGRRGVVVEVVLFCPFYKDAQWKLSPMHHAANVNGLGRVGREDVYTLDRHGGLLEVHEALTRKIVRELGSFDNVYYEVCNEPYFGGVTLEWQRRIVDVIVETEAPLPHRHLISRNVANGKARVTSPHPAVSIFNFHYASPPETVAINYGLGKVIGDNETGFKGTGDRHYRMEGWEFLLAGGGLFNHLDYSFAVGHEDGSFRYPSTQPGGGNATLRRQIATLRRFVESFDFVRMKPSPDVVESCPEGTRATCLAERGRQYAIYLHGGASGAMRLRLPAGSYALRWTHPLTGETTAPEAVDHAAGDLEVEVPPHREDIALRLVARDRS